MKKLLTISQLVEAGYPRKWLYRIAHSEDFTLAGGRREPVRKSVIRFDQEKLDRYMEKQTLIYS